MPPAECLGEGSTIIVTVLVGLITLTMPTIRVVEVVAPVRPVQKSPPRPPTESWLSEVRATQIGCGELTTREQPMIDSISDISSRYSIMTNGTRECRTTYKVVRGQMTTPTGLTTLTAGMDGVAKVVSDVKSHGGDQPHGSGRRACRGLLATLSRVERSRACAGSSYRGHTGSGVPEQNAKPCGTAIVTLR
jgi:hypothetical protein